MASLCLDYAEGVKLSNFFFKQRVFYCSECRHGETLFSIVI